MSYLFPWSSLEKPIFGEVTKRRIFEKTLHDVFIAKNNEEEFMIFFVLKNDYKVLLNKDQINLNSIELDFRKDVINHRYYFLIKLNNFELLPLFDAFINHVLLEAVYEVDEEKLIKKMLNCIKKWQFFMLAGSDGFLREESIIGLLGELYFLKNMLEKYSKNKFDILKAWYGPEKIQHDFIFDKVNVEIKSIGKTDKSVITISSLNQLDSLFKPLYLVVFSVIQVSKREVSSFTLNSLYNEVINFLDPDDTLIFNSKLLSCGYIENKKYDEKFYVIKNIANYHVEGNFPRLISSMVPQGVIDLKYQLDINFLNDYKVKSVEVF